MAKGIDYRNIFNDNRATQIVEGEELIQAELYLLLNFPKYSLFFGNNMGLDLEKYLNITNKTAAFNLIRADLEEFFAKYRRVQLVNLELEFDNSNLAININLTVSYNSRLMSIPLTLSN